jgi:hypothetical protein
MARGRGEVLLAGWLSNGRDVKSMLALKLARNSRGPRLM